LNPICPYCRTEVGDAEGERRDCPGCGTPHHADCYAENGGCTVFGCANAPSDEAKVTVSGTDLMGNTVTRQAPAPVARQGISLGSGYTTFRAPSPDAAPRAPDTAPGGSAGQPPLPPPPPPPMAGTGVAPPPQAGPGSQTPTPNAQTYYLPVSQPKTRVAFVLLGIFLGVFGVHNFYAGYIKKGTIQLCLTLLTCFYGAAISLVWAIIEICTVNQDADGTQFV
jgi:TM2 domain-containing membrane protein YozV